MKFKFINPSNCVALLPDIFDQKILRELDRYLDELNNYTPHKNIISKLITKNQKTAGKEPWDRIFSYDIDICYDVDFSKGTSGWRLQDYVAFPEYSRQGINKKIDVSFSIIYPDGIRWTFRLPIQYLLKNWGDANNGYQGYNHCVKTNGKTDLLGVIDPNNSEQIEKCYTGITSRNWLKRLEEHLREVRNGGQKLFHRAWREAIDGKNLVYSSYLQWVNLTYDQAMEWEERYVEKRTLCPLGFNMIPGGHEGFRHLYKHRITDKIEINLDDRDRAITEYLRQNPRKGVPNPFMSELWKEDEHYLKVMNSKAKALNAEQVRKIRELDKEGVPISQIVIEIDALNEKQVKNVIAGKTYTRIT